MATRRDRRRAAGRRRQLRRQPAAAGRAVLLSRSRRPGCTDPGGPGNALQAQVDANRQAPIGPPALFQSYPARCGPRPVLRLRPGQHDARRSRAVLASHGASPPPSRIPPEAEITSPEWYEQVEPLQGDARRRGRGLRARRTATPARSSSRPASTRTTRRTTDSPPGDFAPLGNGWCDGHTQPRGEPLDGVLGADLDRRAEVPLPAGARTSTGPSRRRARPTTTAGRTPLPTRSPSSSSCTPTQRRPRA